MSKKVRSFQWFIERLADYEAHMHAISSTVFVGGTEFQEVAIMESPVFGKMLTLDGDLQSAELDEFIYHEALVHPGLVFHPHPEDILILGGGEGATLREVLRHSTVRSATMVDIDGELVQICRRLLPGWSQGAFDDKRTRLVIADGKKTLEEFMESFDVIISDLTEPLSYSPSRSLLCKEFFETIKAHLRVPGIFSLQSSRGEFPDIYVHSSISRTLRSVFAQVRTCIVRIPSFDTMWTFTFCTDVAGLLSIDTDTVDARLSERGVKNLRFYDGETHRGIFSLPKYFRVALTEQGRVIEGEASPIPEREPVFLI